MRKLPFVVFLSAILLCAFTAPAETAHKVTAAELEQLLSKTRNTSDSYLAEKISSLSLTERMSHTRLEALQARYSGKKTRDALLALSAVSQPFALPAAELPPDPAPSMSEQQRIIKLATKALVSRLHAMPNFLADRKTVFYEDSKTDNFYFFGTNRLDMGAEKRLHVVQRSTQRVTYRNGTEVLDSSAPARKAPSSISSQLTSSGEFGSSLMTILVDAPRGNLTWSHWERGTSGLEAYFVFHVPQSGSHFLILYPCGNAGTEHNPAYQAEFAVDPATGDILRLQISATLPPPCPAAVSTIITDYGPTQIGGRSYICPLHSVTLSQFPPIDRTGPSTELNDVTFTNYRLFRAEARIVSVGGDPEPEPKH